MMKHTFAGLTYRLLLLSGIVSLLAACLFAVIPGAHAASAAPLQNDAFVRVVHASPAAGTVDVYVDGSKLLSNFTFGTVTGYVSVPAGPHNIQVAPAGKGISAAVITQSVSVEANMAYTVAAIGTSSIGFSLAASVDNNLLSGGMAKIRVYHLSPDAGPVDVAAGSNTVISGLTYKNASAYLTVPPGAYTFTVTATQAGAKVPVSATLNGGMVYSVFAVGLLKGSPAISFKLTAVAGVPGMPNTGSDPYAVTASHTTSTGTPFDPWLLGLLGLVLLGSGVAARRYVHIRQK